VIRSCTANNTEQINSIINEAAEAYRGIIPDDCWHEPYMSLSGLANEIADGVKFSGWDETHTLAGVMGIQTVGDATLIRHAYVRPAYQGQGIGSKLLQALTRQAKGALLVGTWADARWAIRLYQKHGFKLVSTEEKDRLLRTYWKIPDRQREVSVVLRNAPYAGKTLWRLYFLSRA